MKNFILTFLLALVSTVGTMAQTKFYESCRNNPQFETVYIGKAMLRMVNSSKLHVDGMNLNTVVDKLESIQVISAEKSKPAKQLKEMAYIEFSPATQYEIMMEANDNNDTTTIFYKKLKNNSNEYILINSSVDFKETTVIILTGTISPEDLKNLKRL